MKRWTAGITILLVIAFATALATRVRTNADVPLDPAAVRQAALDIGLGSLAHVPVPDVENLGEFLNDGIGARSAALVLGKALFWDMQVGSDGQACASCHFHAGADNRAKNQLNPGLRGVPPDASFGNAGFPQFGPNSTLTEADFPFHELADPEQENFTARQVLRDTNDVASSQGVFNATFASADGPNDQGTPTADGIFNVHGVNVRRVEPRNTPTVINAVFNFENFWDGRAKNEFNGVTPLGLLDDSAAVLVNDAGVLREVKVVIPNSSLASQAVGPPLSPDEMSFAGRRFTDVGQKLANVGNRVVGLRPLALQRVHTADSVLGPYSRGRQGLPGLTLTSYSELIKTAFRTKYWSSRQVVTFDAGGNRVILSPPVAPDVRTYSQMEANFSLFFGLAVQMYESALISDRTPFDRFVEGDDNALTEDQLKGLLIFINRGRPEQLSNPVFAGVSQGNCVSCHGGPEFTDAAFTSLAEDGEELELIEVEETPGLVGGLLSVSTETGLLDNGFSNIGVRPTGEDLGRGGAELGKPLSFVRGALAGYTFAPELPCGEPPLEPCPAKLQVDGAFKIPGLRNVELTGPYFHNGGQATLEQVVEFYDRRGDFSDVNIANLDRNMALLDLNEGDEELVIEFLLALTDERVRYEAAPFDHPQLFVPDGHPGDQALIACVNGLQACDHRIEVFAVGRHGRSVEGLPPLATFLGLAHLGPE